MKQCPKQKVSTSKKSKSSPRQVQSQADDRGGLSQVKVLAIVVSSKFVWG